MPRKRTGFISRRNTAVCQQCRATFPVDPHLVAKGYGKYCDQQCYWASMRTEKPLDVDRFWSKVDKSDGCWIWTGKIATNGYGRFSHANRQHAAHRLAWEMAGGPVPDGLKVCHDCPDGDSPACVRNDEPGTYIINGIARPRFGHLWVGTQAENLADMVNKGRSATGDRNGSRTHPEKMQRGPRATDLILRGERTSGAKTTADAVIAIRSKYAAGNVTQDQLGMEYGLSRRQISGIIRRTEWSHVP